MALQGVRPVLVCGDFGPTLRATTPTRGGNPMTLTGILILLLIIALIVFIVRRI